MKQVLSYMALMIAALLFVIQRSFDVCIVILTSPITLPITLSLNKRLKPQAFLIGGVPIIYGYSPKWWQFGFVIGTTINYYGGKVRKWLINYCKQNLNA